MRRSRSFAAVAILLALLSSALPAQLPSAISSIRSSDIVPILFRVDGPESTGYLYGSIHMATSAAIPPPNLARRAFSLSDRLVTEVRIDTLDEAALAQSMLERAGMPEGMSLLGLLTEEQRELLSTWSRSQGGRIQDLDGFQPWMVDLVVSTLAVAPLGLSTEYGVDAYFSGKATSAGVPQEGLEEPADQLDVMTMGTLEDQAIVLEYSLRAQGAAQATIDLFAAWAHGDVEQLARLIDESYEGDPFLQAKRDALFFDRNERWVPRIEALMETGESLFVVVGAGHLVGPGSVVELLENRGYEVRRVLDEADLD